MLSRFTLVARLTILYALISVVILFGLGMLVVRVTYEHFVDLDLAYLQGKASLIQNGLAAVSDPQARREILTQQMNSHEGLYVAIDHSEQKIHHGEGKEAAGSDNTGNSNSNHSGNSNHSASGHGTELDFSSLKQATVLPGQTHDWSSGSLALRGIRVPLASGEQLLLALDTHHHTHFMTQLRLTLVGYLLLATLMSGVLGWLVARRGLAPLHVMHERARKIDAHQLDVRMPVAGIPVELAELADGLNLMLERLERDFERLSEFSSDLAHELRTPITNLLTQTQVTLTKHRSAEEYREILASNAEEFQRLARMVSDMLYLAKTEHGLELPHREPISLEQEVQALFDFYEAVAEDAGVLLSLAGEARIQGDRLMVRRALGNLLSNALRHAYRHTTIHISIEKKNQAIEVTVQNEGVPIEEAVLPRLFDRFFRTEKSRPHPEHSGTGLGLAITKSIMTLHGGSVRVTSNQKNTSFTLVFEHDYLRRATITT